MSTKRIRPIAVRVTVQAVVDDGESLTPIELQPVEMTASQFGEFDLDAQVAWVQEQIEAKRQETAVE